jgi:hypothetical protein
MNPLRIDMKVIACLFSLLLVFIVSIFLTIEITGWKSPVPLSSGNNVIEVSDTIPVFSSVPVTIYPPFDLQSGVAVLSIDKNRLWNKQDSICKISKCSTISLLASFSDTGIHTIKCIGVQKNGVGCFIAEKSVYVYLPLQPTIDFRMDSVELATVPVNDRVVYVWQFDNGYTILTQNYRITIPVFPDSVKSGMLYVKKDNVISPSVFFNLRTQKYTTYDLL